MKLTDLSPPPSPTLSLQQDALQKGLGRAYQWVQGSHLTDDTLLDACLHDKRYDKQCEENRGEWLWGILKIAGVTERFRDLILKAFQGTTTDHDAEQLCQLAFHYAKAGDADFKTQLYDFVERKPIVDSPWIGEGQLLELGGEEAFRFIAGVRGKLLENREWDWDDAAVMDRVIEKFGDQRVKHILDDSSDASIRKFASVWQSKPDLKSGWPKINQAERMRAIPVSHIFEAVHSQDKCFWLRGWGMHSEEAKLKEVLEKIWSMNDPVIVAKLLRVFSNRPLPAFDPRLIELCMHADSDVQGRAFAALANNVHHLVREFAISQLEEGLCSNSVVSLLINNYGKGDEQRILELLDLPADDCPRHSVLMDITKLLEKNDGAECSELGVIAYYHTPCELCRFSAARLLHNRHAAPKWLTDECRYDSDEKCRALWE